MYDESSEARKQNSLRFLGLTRIGGNHATKNARCDKQADFCGRIAALRNEHSLLVSGTASKHARRRAVCWMGDLAIDLAIRYQIGTALGDRSVLSAMDIQREEFFATFGKSINDLLLSHRESLKRKRECAARATGNAVPKNFATAQSEFNPKARWVDSTPLYSFYICGLRKLFPEALFIHIIRDVTSVVRSMLNFHRAGGGRLVANEQEAYNYWFRAVSNCLLAERAYGPHIVFRLRYSDFVDAREAALRSLLNFLDEPFAAECLTPLQQRINSSNVPADFKIGDPQTDPSLIEQATRLYVEIEKTPQPREASPATAEEIKAAFAERVQYMATLDGEYCRAQEIITRLQARAERLAENVKGKKAIIEHLRGRRKSATRPRTGLLFELRRRLSMVLGRNMRN